MKWFLTTLVICLCAFVHAQDDLQLGLSTTSSNYIGGIISSTNNKERPFIGSGFLLFTSYRFKRSKTSSLVYGIEYSSTRHTFWANGFDPFFSNTSLKTALLYQFRFNVNGRVSPVARIGLNNLVQMSQQTTTVLRKNNEILTNDKRGGIYPMAQLCVGADFRINQRHSLMVLLGMSKGFILNEKLHYTNTQTNTVQSYETDGSYFDLRVIWCVQKKARTKKSIAE